ncbi:DUF6687 family protein [Rhizobacter sp. Root1221]|uniref:DUF6687 family protein n=1 Tax=Rhizobacter sp. Root1221 TaxID=1736433 RepID=UPI0006F7F506|nr:DUF6687 family protein [Rhizobacter sp. Root1221]KQV90448.1 hypothetical protein ASC87_28280 [Rhizobacter sp. Root1221]
MTLPATTPIYVPSDDLGDRPCVVVDGAPRPGSLITLSHWPGSGTPAPLMDDLSTQIAFHYLDQPAFHVVADAVTSDHFDEDGLASLFVVTQPREALARRGLVCDFASAGDFGTWRTREAARCAFVVSAYADPERSPLGPEFFAQPEGTRVAGLYTELLGHLPTLLDHPDRYAHLWQEEERVLDATELALRSGAIRIDEVPSLDLAVVTLPPDAVRARVHRFAQVRQLAYHPMAIYNATSRLRILYVTGRNYEVEYRYESWVQYKSCRPLPRVDLGPLAARLSAEEAAGTWVFDGVDALTPRLRLDGAAESRIPVGRFQASLMAFLSDAPPAWNPYLPKERP